MGLNIKKLVKIISPFFLFLFSSLSIANSVDAALTASRNNQNAAAVKIWSQLADSGNPIAQFNLANHYVSGSGVQKNNYLADESLKRATRSGLVQAYLNLNNKAIAPANGLTISFDVGPIFWLDKQEPKKYTVQLASSQKEKLIKKYYEENDIKGQGGYYHYIRNGVDRYALIYGTYDSVGAANAAIANFPEKLRKWTPWVRKIKSLQKISK